MSNATKLSARDRINALVDANSFVEIGALVTKRSTDFNMQEKSVPGDGVITGYGLVDGSVVYVYSQDASAMGGSIGEMHANKICRMYDMAMKAGAPVVGIIDCAGFRLQESVDALAAFGSIYAKQAEASGLIPQISAVVGTCGGGVAVSSVMSDFTFMEAGARLFVNSPNAIAGNYTDKCDTSSAQFQGTANTVDFVCDGEEALFGKMRYFISMIPANCEVKALADISDNNEFVEVKAGYAKEMVTGFIKLNGMTIGAVANRAAVIGEDGKAAETFDTVLTTAGCGKAEDFVGYCDSFGIPVLTLTNVTGYAKSMDEEKTIAAAAAKLTAAFACADVPKVNLVTGKAYGSAYITMNSKHVGADLVFALDNAEIGTMDPALMSKLVDTEGEAGMQAAPATAASRGYVDTIISAEAARKQLVYAFEMLY